MQGIEQLRDYLVSGVVFLVMITVLVFVHELGHYWVAKMVGMKVDAFAVMVGGVRRTDLTKYLDKPILDRRIVLGIWFGFVGLMIASGIVESPQLLIAGLMGLALIMPVWVALRLGKLYGLSPEMALKPVAYSYVGGVILFMISRGFRLEGLDTVQLLTVLMYSAFIGQLVAYYRPMLSKTNEDEEMGHGEVDLNGEAIPVRFRPVFSWTNKEGTEFSMLCLPLGGFARIRGMQVSEAGNEVNVPHGFYSRPPLARLAALFAGPLFSFLLGILILFIQVGTFGKVEVRDEPLLGSVLKGSAADKAGLKPDDKILTLDGRPIATFYELVSTVRTKENVPIDVTYERDGVMMNTRVTPTLGKEASPVWGPGMEMTGEVKKQAILGVGFQTQLQPVPLAEAARFAVTAPIGAIGQFGAMFTNLNTAKENVGGPATIAAATHSATTSGIYDILGLAAGLTIGLAFLNLLPIPPLDGGQMVVAFIELLRGGRRVSYGFQEGVMKAGFLLMLLLYVFVIQNDLNRFFR